MRFVYPMQMMFRFCALKIRGRAAQVPTKKEVLPAQPFLISVGFECSHKAYLLRSFCVERSSPPLVLISAKPGF